MTTSPSLPNLVRRRPLIALAAFGLQGCVARLSASMQAPPPESGPTPHAPAPWASPRPAGPTVADQGLSGYQFEALSFVSADGRRQYRVQLAVPLGAPPAAGWPLLAMLDGNAAMAALQPGMLTRLVADGRPLAIATIGYQTDLRFDTQARALDYTPPVPGEDPTWDNRGRNRLGGGADMFLDLLAEQILPAIARQLPLDPARSTLWGHSYGGLLVLHALFMRPALFAHYAAADPSLWWHDGFILQEEVRATPLPAGRTVRLLLMAGLPVAGGPSATPPPGPAGGGAADPQRAQMPAAVQHLAERLAQRQGLELTWLPFPGVSHGPLLAASIEPTLQFAAA